MNAGMISFSSRKQPTPPPPDGIVRPEPPKAPPKGDPPPPPPTPKSGKGSLVNLASKNGPVCWINTNKLFAIKQQASDIFKAYFSEDKAPVEFNSSVDRIKSQLGEHFKVVG